MYPSYLRVASEELIPKTLYSEFHHFEGKVLAHCQDPLPKTSTKHLMLGWLYPVGQQVTKFLLVDIHDKPNKEMKVVLAL